jgi:hypothetical protein
MQVTSNRRIGIEELDEQRCAMSLGSTFNCCARETGACKQRHSIDERSETPPVFS